MKKRFLVWTSSLVFLAACGNPEETVEESIEERTPEETVQEAPEAAHKERAEEEAAEPVDDNVSAELTILAENLAIPWSIEKDKEIFYISQREGQIAKVENGKVEHQAVQLEETIANEAEAGLLGFVLDPQFEETQKAFAYYTYEGSHGAINRVIQLQLNENRWTETTVLLDDIPSGSVHHGGRLALGPDAKLYMTTGDASIPELAQDSNSLAGKIIRMNLDGSIPEDNPFDRSYVYSYGHRNPQGLTWLDDGTMVASEHGNQAHDEMNVVDAGENYGWPIIEGREETENMKAPLFTSGAEETWAPSGLDSKGRQIYAAALRGNAVLAFDLETNEIKRHLTDYGRIRDVYIEDDFLYFITNNTDGRGNPLENDDRLMRIGLSELE